MIGRSGMGLAIAAALLVIITTTLRLGDTPPGLFIDEVAISLTARSLWETGQDLAGHHLPLFPLSYPDREKPMPVNPLYTYTAVPFALAGPGAWSARLPAVIWLWAAAAGIALFAAELTRRWDVGVAIGATAAVSPWLFVLGRIGWEAVSFPAVTAFAFWTLLRGVRTGRGREIAASGALFGLSLYAYSTARLLAPLTVGAVALLHARHPEARRHAWRFLLPFAILAAPLAGYMLLHPGVLTWRLASASIGADGASPAGILGRFLLNHAGYFSPRFLFLEGDPNPRHGTGRGVLLWMWAPLIALGMWRAWKRRRDPAVLSVAAALILAPAGAALLGHGQPHAIRSISAVVFWAGLAALGLQRLLEWSPRGHGAILALAVAAVIEVGPFANDYFGAYRTRAYGAFDDGRGAVLQEAFARRGGRPIYVPPDLHSAPRESVFVPYWGGISVADWIEKGPDALGIHAWKGEAEPGSLIVVDRSGPPPPPASRLIFPRASGVPVRFALYEN